MHRSGTSAVAGALGLLGCELPRHLYQADVGNEKGYFEPARLIDLDDELLASAGLRWDDWQEFPPGWPDPSVVLEFRRRMAALIDEEFTSSLMVIKEPRICRLLPILTGALKDLGIEPRFVLPYRDPVEVALSMASRGGYAMEHGFLLWLRYLLDAERGSREFTRTFLPYDLFLTDWRPHIDRLEHQLGLALPRRTREGGSEIDQFLEPRLKHFTRSLDAARADSLLPWLVEVKRSYIQLTDSPHDELALAALDRVEAEFASGSRIFHATIRNSFATVVELRGHAHALGGQLEAARAEAARALQQLEAERVKLADAWAALSGQLAVRAAEASRLRHQLGYAQQEVAAAKRSLSKMKRSVSWRATRPLRAIISSAKKLKNKKRHSNKGTFDAAWYLEQYPDIAVAGIDPLQHYLEHGKKEGRFGAPPRIDYKVVDHGYDPAKQTVAVVSHEASRTGAPIVALNIIEGLRTKYNVIAIMLGGGGIVDSFEKTATVTAGPIDVKYRLTPAVHPLVQDVCATYRPRYAIVNSIESRQVLPPFNQAGVATVLLVHEFAAYIRPLDDLYAAIQTATEVVYSAQLVWDSTVHEFPSLASRRVHITPQGRVRIPRTEAAADEVSELERIRIALRPDTAPPGTVVVMGGGWVQIRKGVDLFIAVAAAVLRAASATRFRFVWVGGGYDPDNDHAYSTYLAEQIEKSQLDGNFVILDEVSRLDRVYDLADVFLLSARLDPFPNVAIDAIGRGMPLVCFDGASGIAEVLAEQPGCRELVVPYAAIDLAAARILELGENPAYRRQMSAAIKVFAAQAFDMDSYTDRLDEIGRRAAAIKSQEAEDAATIGNDSTFDAEFFSYAGGPPLPRDVAVATFVRRYANGTLDRRPCPEFHPGIYAERHSELAKPPFVNPLARFIREGAPQGDWCIPLITPGNGVASPGVKQLKVALHLHLYYQELTEEFIRALSVNRAACDLFLSTSKPEHVPMIERALGSYHAARVEIRVVPNVGRDIGPLFTAFAEIAAEYDVFGHLHTKRSLAVADPRIGETWRNFCREHLLGAQYPMMDLILKSFWDDPKLGLVFPSDPHIWPIGDTTTMERLAHRLGLDAAIPQHLFYPLGTMFWARTAALAPLFDLGLTWEDYPPEPLPYDGTVLHAIERLVTLIAGHRGFKIAATHVPGIGR
jgi:glycosyltransferase involved in cell wall biosynthesis